MKLTKYEKQSIIKSIMMDVPRPTQNEVKAEIQAALVKAMSPGCRKLYNINPKALATVHLSSWEVQVDYAVNLVMGDADELAVIEPFKAKKKEFEAAEAKLRAAVDGCSTLAQLKKLLPEFISYFPSETEPTKNLPAVANMVADLSRLGWPKNQSMKVAA